MLFIKTGIGRTENTIIACDLKSMGIFPRAESALRMGKEYFNLRTMHVHMIIFRAVACYLLHAVCVVEHRIGKAVTDITLVARVYVFA